MLFDPTAIISLKLLILDDNSFFVISPQLFNSGFELSLCLISDYLCIVQLLIDITLQLFYLFFMSTQ